ncbi:MAG TPA: SDR family NAD(P)-dependent oxidoreductase [Lunatimonas sp.]|nr:SDR family NAD(P)-dependent oxidoreductase [Lunatimonas sp.]
MNLAITGPTSGIGVETVKALASKFNRIFLLVRSEEKAVSLIAEFFSSYDKGKFVIIPCDLGDLTSVSKAADLIKDQVDSLHVLINNAGGIFPEGKLTGDKLEQTFQINHLGHFLLTIKLMPLLENAGEAKVINVSSEAHKAAKPKLKEINDISKYSSFPAYANAKLFNILFSKSLSEKYADKGIHSYSLHPGVVKTNFGGDFSGVFKFLIKLAQPFMINAAQGAKTTVFLASTATDSLESGAYFKKSKRANPSKTAVSATLREKLWNMSQDLVKEYL